MAADDLPPSSCGEAGTMRLEIVNVEGRTAVILPEEALVRLGVQREGMIFALETPTGLELRNRDPELEHQIEIAEGVMDDCREALRALARSDGDTPFS